MFTKTTRLFTMLALLCCVWTCAAGAQTQTLAIIPLAVHAEQEMSYLAHGATKILASRIASGAGVIVLDTDAVEAAMAESGQTLTQATARAVGNSLKADYVLSGSITRLGDQFSLDVIAISVDEKSSPLSFFEQTDNINGVIPAISTIAEKINRDLFAVQPSRQATAPLTASPPPENPPIYAHPETLLNKKSEPASTPAAEQPPSPPATDNRAASPFVVAEDRPETRKNFWKSPNLDMEACGLAVADVDGDGKNEVVIISPDSLDVRRLERDRFYKVAEYQAGANERLLTVDAVDTDNDGRAEIFVTCVKNTSQRLCSFVLSLSGDQLDIIAEKQNWYFRSPTSGQLAGQKKGLSEIFLSGIWRLERKDGGYVEQEQITIPGTFSVFSFCPGDADNDGDSDLIVLDNDDKLRLYDNNETLLWKGSEHVGGSETRLTGGEDAKGGATEDLVYLPQRVIVSDINGDGKNEVLTVYNKAVGRRLFQRFRRYSQASFLCLSWDGLGLSELWHTSPVSGYASDFALADINNDGNQELVAVIVSSRDSIIARPKSAVIYYETGNIQQ